MPAAGWKRWVIDYDQPCPHCAYSLRGLRPKDRCPECGKEIPDYSLRDERYMLHRAGKPYLTRLVQGANLMLLVLAVVVALIIAAGAEKLPGESVEIGVLVALLGWGIAWQLAASPDAVEPASAPNNTAARTTRLTAAVAVLCGCAVILTHRFDLGPLLGRFFSGDVVGMLGFALYLGTAVAAFAHFGAALSYYELVTYRVRRLVPGPRKGRFWWLAVLAFLVLPLVPFAVSAIVAWRLRRAGVAALRATA